MFMLIGAFWPCEINTCEIGKDDWGEIDFHPDIEQIQKEISKNKDEKWVHKHCAEDSEGLP